MTDKPGLTYRDAGVDIDAGNALIDRIRPAVRRTLRPEVLTDLGGFGGLFALGDYRSPVLVSGTDGVGTKVLLAKAMGRHDTIGIDLVAMCVNDVIVQGAEPLFFLDYFATGKLDTEIAAAVIDGIASGCQQAGCALIGGETAEMPDVYGPGDYDLAGFNVGVVEREELIDGSAIKAGDSVVGLASSGPHSNGFSLIRAIVERTDGGLGATVDGRPLGDWLLTPTTIYVGLCQALKQRVSVHGLAHITGGGLVENLLRVVPEGLGLDLDLASWRWPAPFQWLARNGNVARDEMMRTFNCGIGFCVVVAPADVDAVAAAAASEGIEAYTIGRISDRPGQRLLNDVLHA